MTWMALYFSAAVWASLALCVCYALQGELPRYRTEATAASHVVVVSVAAAPFQFPPSSPGLTG
jgi:hypothetical protein